MNSLVKNKAVRDILSLYELSLAIGGSLDFDQTIKDFVEAFMPKKSYNYISFWIDKTGVSGLSSAKSYKLIYASPDTYVDKQTLPSEHIILKLLDGKDFIQISSNDDEFNEIVSEKNIDGGSYVLYSLGSIGFIKLYDSNINSYDPIELTKLTSVIQKLNYHLVACIYHERALDLAEERKRLLYEIQERDSTLKNILNNYPGLFWLKDINGKYTYINSNDKTLQDAYFQHSVEDLIGKSDEDLFDNERLKRVEHDDKYLRSSKTSIRRTISLLFKGEIVWGEIVKFPIIKEGKVTAIACFIIDVTQVKSNEHALLLHNTAIESISHAMSITNANGEYTFVNKAFEKITGYTKSEIAGKSPKILNSGHHSDLFYNNLWKTIKRGEVFKSRMVDKNKDGEIINIKQTITPISNSNGDITHYVSVFNDISKELAIKEELLLSEHRWQFALDAAGIGVWDWNASTDEVYFSKKWKSMLGFGDDEIGNTLDEWSSRVHKDDIDRCYKDLDNHFNNKTEYYINVHRMMHKDGEYRWISDRGKVIKRDVEGKPLRVVGTHTDITPLKDVENRLRIGIEKEKELNAMRAKFISVASHEFRTPLATLTATTEGVMRYFERMDTHQIQAKLSKIHKQAHHMTEIVDEVLNVDSPSKDNSSLKFEKVDLVSFIESIINELNQSIADDRVKLSTSVRKINMQTNKKLFYQIISNLVSNSLKFSKDEINIDIYIIDKEVNIEVADKGVGIAKDEMKNIFEPFYRGTNTTSVSGVGLGLNIVNESTHKLNGKIEIDSIINRGTTVTIKLPLNVNK